MVRLYGLYRPISEVREFYRKNPDEMDVRGF
jgi:hypothetical protein